MSKRKARTQLAKRPERTWTGPQVKRLVTQAINQKFRAMRGSVSNDWVWPTTGMYRSYHDVGLWQNHAAMMAMGVQWVGICATYVSVQATGVPVRLCRRAGSGGMVGRWAGARVRDRKRLEWMRDPKKVGKSAQYAEQAGDIEEIYESPILDLLHHPNPWDSYASYHRRLFQSLQLPGNGYELWAEDDDAIQLLGLLPQFTRVQPSDDTLIDGYIYGRTRAQEVRYDPAVVIHHMHMPATDNHWYGVGPLHNVVAEANIYAQAVAYELNGLINGMRPGDIAITVPEETNDIQVEMIRAQLRQKYQGAKNAQIPMVIPGGEVTNLAQKNKEMEYREGMKAMGQMIMASYGVNEELVMRSQTSLGGDKGKSDAYVVFARTTLTPQLAAVDEKRNDQLIRLFGIEPGDVWLVHDDPCPENETSATDMKAKVDGAIITINEAREDEGREALPEGDELRYNGVPLDQVGQMSGMDTGNPGDLDNGGNGKASKVALATAIWWKSAQWRETRDTKASDFDARPVAMTMRELEIALRAWFKGVHTTVIDSADLATGGVSLAFTPEQQQAFDTAVTPPLSQAAVHGFNKAITDLTKAGKLPTTMKPATQLSTGAAARMEHGVDRLFKSVESSLTDHIRTSLADGIEQGETIGKLTQRVKEIAGPGTENASHMIARTESVRAYNTAREDGWRESGNVKYKRWVLSGNPCPVCRAMAAKFQKVPVGQPMLGEGESIGYVGGTYTNDYAAIYGPPAHPHCACSVSAVFE